MNRIDNDFIVLVTSHRLLMPPMFLVYNSLISSCDPLTAHPGKITGRQTPESEVNRVLKNKKHEYRQILLKIPEFIF
jgi:hypothetical protein